MYTYGLIVTVISLVSSDYLSSMISVHACFNPCTSLPPGTMCPGKTCVMDTDCNWDCVCDETSTAESCLESVTETEEDENDRNNTTPAPAPAPGANRCPDDVTCVHGFCNSLVDSGIKCVCDEGWVGDDCNDQFCNLNCSEEETCAFVGPVGLPMCISSTESNTDPTPVLTSFAPVQRERNVCNKSYYEFPPMSENQCFLFCKYGVCKDTNGSFACDCDPGSSGQGCQNECCLDCGSRGKCYYDDMREEATCNCYFNFTGPRCEEIKQLPSTVVISENSTWYKWVVGVSLSVLVVLLVLLVVVPYVMWRHRVVLVMKIVHFFQSYEDDDDRQWDAFVSYKSSTMDEEFVARTLFPKLERELGFKLHLHFRDFIPGDTIANNIIRAVVGSRRTILIVSPEFASSEWTKFEYQIAQQEMLKRKHQIIPIVLEDINKNTEDFDPNLKAILGTVTYLEWPKCGSQKKIDKFWKRLQLSLPKKRTNLHDTVEDGIDNRGYNIQPEAIDIAVIGEHKDKVGHHLYITGDPEEDYDTINEAEMDNREVELSDCKDYFNETDGKMEIQYDKKDYNSDKTLSDRNDQNNRKGDVELNNVLNEKYIDILNGGMKTVEV